MSISCFIYKATTKKPLDFKDVYKNSSSYQLAFNKAMGLLTKKSYYTQKSTKKYF